MKLKHLIAICALGFLSYLPPTGDAAGTKLGMLLGLLDIKNEFRPYNLDYQVYSRARPILGKKLRMRNPLESGFNPKKRTAVLIHGFSSTSKLSGIHSIKNGLLKRHNMNVIILDYGIYATTYERVIRFYKPVGRAVADVLIELQSKTNYTYDSLYFIGHSAGVHVAAYAARNLPSKPRRITGLDTSNLRHLMPDRDDYLLPSDAMTVDCIHTSTSFGAHPPICDCDYYANNGKEQNGCVTELCNHMSAFAYFINTLTKPQIYPAYECDLLTENELEKCGNITSFAGILGDRSCTPGKYRFNGTLNARDLEVILKMELEASENVSVRILRTIGIID